jgi:hypothetical protein
MEFPTWSFSLKELEMRPIIYSKESALAEYGQLNHTMDLIKAEVVAQKIKLAGTFAGHGHGADYIKDKLDEILGIAMKIFWERKCLLMCMGFVNVMEDNKDLPAN